MMDCEAGSSSNGQSFKEKQAERMKKLRDLHLKRVSNLGFVQHTYIVSMYVHICYTVYCTVCMYVHNILYRINCMLPSLSYCIT